MCSQQNPSVWWRDATAVPPSTTSPKATFESSGSSKPRAAPSKWCEYCYFSWVKSESQPWNITSLFFFTGHFSPSISPRRRAGEKGKETRTPLVSITQTVRCACALSESCFSPHAGEGVRRKCSIWVNHRRRRELKATVFWVFFWTAVQWHAWFPLGFPFICLSRRVNNPDEWCNHQLVRLHVLMKALGTRLVPAERRFGQTRDWLLCRCEGDLSVSLKSREAGVKRHMIKAWPVL